MLQASNASLESKLSLERFYLLLIAAFIIIYSLAPFDFYFSINEFNGRLIEALNNSFSESLFEILGHFIGFFILGSLFAAVKERSLQYYGFGWFVLAAIIFCTILEFSQLFIPTRHASLTDLFCNTAGVLIGARSSLRWRRVRSIRMSVQDYSRHCRVQSLAVIFIAACAIWVVAGIHPLLSGLKMDWHKDYHLAIGNEVDGNRPWLGEIRYMGIYGRALTEEQVQLIYNMVEFKNRGLTGQHDLNLLVGYDFTQGYSNIISPAGLIRPGNLSIQVPVESGFMPTGEGLYIKDKAILLSQGSAFELTEAILSSGEFSVEGSIRPFKEIQEGPARILSLSESNTSRNFMLAQEADGLTFRVRNSINGKNGSRYALHIKDALQEGLQHVVAVYDHGVSSLFLNGQLLKPVVDLREPIVNILVGSSPTARIASGILLTLTITLPAYSILSFVRKDWMRHLLSMGTTFCIGGAPYAVSCLYVGGPLRMGLFIWLGIAMIIIYPLCFVYVYKYR